jgi:hypothetical protein
MSRSKDNIKIDLKETGGGDNVWIGFYLALDRAHMFTVMKFFFSLKSEDFLNSWATISFSRTISLHGVIQFR